MPMSDFPGRGRRRPPPQPVEVVRVERITPRLVSVHLSGGDLTRFQEAAPTAHIKLFLPAPGQDAPTLPTMGPEGRVWPEGAVRPTVRTYQAKPGDRLALGGPGGRFGADLDAPRWWIAGDESALPAVATLLDTLPASASAEVHLEVEGPDDEVALSSAAGLAVSWHHRRSPGAFGEELYDAATQATISGGTQVWVACEASAMRRIRRRLLDSGVPHPALVTRGYWRLGVADHPDHDHGDD